MKDVGCHVREASAAAHPTRRRPSFRLPFAATADARPSRLGRGCMVGYQDSGLEWGRSPPRGRARNRVDVREEVSQHRVGRLQLRVSPGRPGAALRCGSAASCCASWWRALRRAGIASEDHSVDAVKELEHTRRREAAARGGRPARRAMRGAPCDGSSGIGHIGIGRVENAGSAPPERAQHRGGRGHMPYPVAYAI